MKKTKAYNEKTKKTGFLGFFETLLRKFHELMFMILLIPLILAFLVIISIAVSPGLFFVLKALELSAGLSIYLKSLILALAVVSGYFVYGLSIIFIVPMVYRLNPFKPKPFRGPWSSLECISWYVYNALLYIPRYTFLDFITPTPLLNLFYKMMGMKIGKNTVINTTNISDACFITLGDRVTIGGSATIFAHYAQKGVLVVAPVTIGNDVNIGLKASIMGDVTIEDGAFVTAHSVVYPKTKIKKDEKFNN